MWNRESAVAALEQAGLTLTGQREIDHAVQLQLRDGTTVNVYTSGKAVVGGRRSDEKTKAEQIFASAPQVSTPTALESLPAKPDKVFIVYGHDVQCREQLELLLRRLDITPIILANLVPSGLTIIEALEQHSEVPFALVLLTGDDEGYPKGQPTQARARARQNVVLELGMFLMKLGRSRVGILHKGAIELPSDISGLIYIPFENDVREAKNLIAASLQQAGFEVSIAALSAE
jgi:predicted nucleotide-binding protein